MKYILISALLISLLSCKSNQDVINTKAQPNNSQSLQIKMPEQVKTGQTLNIEISTNYDEGIVLYDPMLLRVERFENDEWLQVRILHCPCGAYCEPPPREKKLVKNEIWKMSWNLKETWCENVKGQEIPNTKEISAVPGIYRCVFYYEGINNERIKQTKEFKIIN